MIHTVLVGDKTIRLEPSKVIGKGGEADIYRFNTTALKIYKPPDHPDFQGLPQAQQGARERIAEHQKKLPAFPKNLPPHVIAPVELVRDTHGMIVGYVMPFLNGAEVLMRYSEKQFRQSISFEDIKKIFLDLHISVVGIHEARVVIGDFNDLNILVLGNESYLIDADSFQFGPFLCRLFTNKFVDPLLCDPTKTSLELVRPHTSESDWYAFTIMLFQTLLLVDPYGGIYRPKNPQFRIPHGQRPLKRITVFNPEVQYPKPAIPYEILPDELLQIFTETFEKDVRKKFPSRLIESLRFTKCINCGTWHARNSCPSCRTVAPIASLAKITIRGNVTATRMFHTGGTIVYATYQHGAIRYLYHDGTSLFREDGSLIATGALDPRMRFRISGSDSLIGLQNQLVTFKKDTKEQLTVDAYGSLAAFDANEKSRFWISGGQLLRDGALGPEFVGDVLTNQTLFWVGPTFGFGFYRAGNLQVAFVFHASQGRLNDQVEIPRIRGQLIDSTCVFSSHYAWFFTATRESGKTINRCMVLTAEGKVVATSETEDGDGTWLGTIRGKCAGGNYLLASTDDGIVRVEPNGTMLVVTKEFPDTEPFVSSGSYLFPGADGLYVVKHKEVYKLTIS